MFEIQKRLGLKRAVPADLEIMIGSQWWCLRRRTVEWILSFARKRRDVMRFFATTWIPDETFFQTLVRHLVPGHEIQSRTLTFLMFTDYGMPVVFYNDHYDLLLSQDFDGLGCFMPLTARASRFPTKASRCSSFSPKRAGSDGALRRGSGKPKAALAANAN
jgi:hypothetical protein